MSVQSVNEQFASIWSGGLDPPMKRTPRRQHARLKAWVYLALFGADDDTGDTEDAGSDSEQGDDQDDAPSPSE